MKRPNILHRFKPWHLLWLLAPLLLWLALKDIHWADVWSTLARLTLWQVLALVVINLVVLFFFSVGWWLILRAFGYPVPLRTLVTYRLAAFGIAYFTPGPQVGGEPLQVYLLQRQHNVPTPTAAAATALDRVLELLINFLFLAAGILLITQWDVWPGASPLLALGVVAALVAAIGWFLWLTWHGRLPLTFLMLRLPIHWAPYTRLLDWVAESERQVTVFCRNNPRTLLAVVGMASLNWLLLLTEYWLGMYFLGLPLTPQQLITAVTINRLAFLVPLPAGLGALEGSQVLAMTLLGLNPAFGISEGLIIRLRDVVTALVGLWVGWRVARRAPKATQRI
jgi:glycosyltransferase 2 family protein